MFKKAGFPHGIPAFLIGKNRKVETANIVKCDMMNAEEATMEKYNFYELIYMYHAGSKYAGVLMRNTLEGYLRFWTNEKVQKKPNGSRIFYEDLYQEALIALYDAMDSYREDKDACFLTYCKKIVDAKQINFINRKIYKCQSSAETLYSWEELVCKEDEAYLYEPETKDKLSYPEYKLAFNECADTLNTTIKRMSVAEQKVFYSWFDGDSYDEGCKKLAMTKKKYDGKLQKVKRTIRKLYDEDKIAVTI